MVRYSRPARALRRYLPSQFQSNLFRPDLFCLSVNILDLESIQLTLARTCAVIVNVPDLKAYSSVAAQLLRRVTSYASSEALLSSERSAFFPGWYALRLYIQYMMYSTY